MAELSLFCTIVCPMPFAIRKKYIPHIRVYIHPLITLLQDVPFPERESCRTSKQSSADPTASAATDTDTLRPQVAKIQYGVCG